MNVPGNWIISKASSILLKFYKSVTLIFSGLTMGKVFKFNTWLLILDPEVAIWDLLSSSYCPYCPAEYMYSEKICLGLGLALCRHLGLLASATCGSSIKSQILDLKTLPIFSPLKISVIALYHCYHSDNLWMDSTHNSLIKWEYNFATDSKLPSGKSGF